MDPTELNDACGAEPGSFCEWVFDLTDSVRATQFANWFTHNPLRIAVIILLAWVLNVVAGRAIRRLVERLVRERAAKAAPSGERGERIRNELWGERAERSRQRTLTMGAVLRSISSFAIFTVAALLCLGEFGIDLAPLLAGAGIAGLAIGFGAQSLVRDILAGVFIVIEDQYGVGDTVDLGEAEGVVEQVTLRTTTVRDLEGTVWVVPNGEIKRVANKSQLWARAVVDLRVSHTANLDLAMQTVRASAASLLAAEPRALEAPEVLGVESFTDAGVVIRVTVRTEPGAQFQIARTLRGGIKHALDEALATTPGAATNVVVPPSAASETG